MTISAQRKIKNKKKAHKFLLRQYFSRFLQCNQTKNVVVVACCAADEAGNDFEIVHMWKFSVHGWLARWLVFVLFENQLLLVTAKSIRANWR